MAIQNISQVYCSLNLGYVYNVNYDYTPQNGCSITLFFVTQNGQYQRPRYMQKAQIRIGSASFSMYVVASDIQLASGRRVMSVEFVDEMFQLDWYQVVLTGKGCGFRVYELGTPVDNRTLAQKQAAALDPIAQQIADFTTFPDVEYTFGAFITVLRQHFTVQTLAPFNATVTNPFTGSFRDVLDEWCSFFNLAWFVENSIIKIFNPVTLTINLPTQPTDAIEFSSSEDVRSTYGKTCYNWFQQEGGEFPLNQTSNDDGSILVRTHTLYPVGSQYGLNTVPDLNQVAAAQFGEQFWFLYNYSKGTTSSECGWTPVLSIPSSTVAQSLANAGGRLVIQNSDVFNGKFEAYQEYGQRLAGRIYMSNELNDLAVDKTFTWFDESQGQITSFVGVDDKTLTLDFLTPVGGGLNILPGTPINQFYSGVNYVGNRIVYEDTSPPVTSFSLGALQVGPTFQNIFSMGGSQSMDLSSLDSLATGNNVLLAYNPTASIPANIQALINNISDYTTGLRPRFASFPIKGVRTSDYASLKASQSESDDVEIINGDEGGNVISNTAVIKTLKQGAYTVYYDKYSQCASAHSTGPYFAHKFDPRQISPDNTINFSFNKQAANAYQIDRDFSTINALVNNPLLPTLAQARSFPTRKVSFTVNYFRDVPTNFLTNGLVGLSVSIGDNGVTASYSYSNEVLQVPYPENRFAQYEQQVRNSAVRRYTPTAVIS